MLDLKRREFIVLAGGGGLLLAVKVRRARGQQPAMPVVGFVGSTSPGSLRDAVAAFHRGLTETGYVDGQRVNTIDCRDLRPIWFTVRWL
jgi:putative ABC transport system substrate-binding protein